MGKGRPTKYNDKVANRICAEISTSRLGLEHICNSNKSFPDARTVYRWLSVSEEFRQKYARAKELQAELIAEEILEIADDGSNDWMTITKGDQEYEVENKEVVNRSRLRVDTRKWLLSKLLPRKYGDKVAVTGGSEGDKPVEFTVKVIGERK